MIGPYAPVYWTLICCNVHRRRSCCGSRRCGTNILVLLVISIVVNIGMWLERFVIVVTSLHRDFLPVRLGHVLPDHLGLVAIFTGTLGFFVFMFFLFLRFLPVISIFEMRTLLPEAKVKEGGRGIAGSGSRLKDGIRSGWPRIERTGWGPQARRSPDPEAGRQRI